MDKDTEVKIMLDSMIAMVQTPVYRHKPNKKKREPTRKELRYKKERNKKNKQTKQTKRRNRK